MEREDCYEELLKENYSLRENYLLRRIITMNGDSLEGLIRAFIVPKGDDYEQLMFRKGTIMRD